MHHASDLISHFGNNESVGKTTRRVFRYNDKRVPLTEGSLMTSFPLSLSEGCLHQGTQQQRVLPVPRLRARTHGDQLCNKDVRVSSQP